MGLQARIRSLTFTGCYIHDSLASGISLKGADETLIENNVIERAGYRAIGVG
jgi:parallel beta-helix repeat protein